MLLIITILATLGGQVPREIVHVNVLFPVAKPVTLIFVEFNVPEVKVTPLGKVHVPVSPDAGELALSEAVLEQTCELLAGDRIVAVVCNRLLTIFIVDVDGGHVPLDIVHVTLLAPIGRLAKVIFVALIVPEVMVAPEGKVHVPVSPDAGEFALKLIVPSQLCALFGVEILATVITVLLIITTFAIEGGHPPLEIVHVNVLFPADKPEILIFVEFTVPEVNVTPLGNVQVPVSLVPGVLPISETVFVHTCVLFAGEVIVAEVDNWLFVTTTVSFEDGQVPRLIVHVILLFPKGKFATVILVEFAFPDEKDAPDGIVQVPISPVAGLLADKLSEPLHVVKAVVLISATVVTWLFDIIILSDTPSQPEASRRT